MQPEEESSAALPKLEWQPFEHYDNLMLVFRNEQGFQQARPRRSWALSIVRRFGLPQKVRMNVIGESRCHKQVSPVFLCQADSVTEPPETTATQFHGGMTQAVNGLGGPIFEERMPPDFRYNDLVGDEQVRAFEHHCKTPTCLRTQR